MRRFQHSYLTTIVILLTAILIAGGCSRNFTVVKAQSKANTNQQGRTQYDPNRVPSAVDEQLHEGLILFREGRYDEAQGLFEEAIAADPDGWSGHYYLARLMIHQKKYDPAIDELYLALDLAPDEPRTRSNIYRSLAECLELQGQFTKAELHYRTALNLFPESTPAREGLSRLQSVHQSSPQ